MVREESIQRMPVEMYKTFNGCFLRDSWWYFSLGSCPLNWLQNNSRGKLGKKRKGFKVDSRSTDLEDQGRLLGMEV